MTSRASVQNRDHLPAQVAVPDIDDGMVEDGTQLLLMAVGLRSAGRGPLLLFAVVDQHGIGREASIEALSHRKGDSMGIVIVGSRGGRGDGILVNGLRPLSLVVTPREANAFLDKLGKFSG